MIALQSAVKWGGKMLGLLGKKIGMTQVFDENGRQTAVTVIEAGPIYVTQIKTKERDGYIYQILCRILQ